MKKILSSVLCAALLSASAGAVSVSAENTADTVRQVEYLGRGGYGIAVDDGVYLSWRLLGTEPQEQTFDIYRNDEMILSGIDATNYTDKAGAPGDVYKVTPHGGAAAENDVFIASARDYKDVILDKPEGGDGFTYEFNDAAIGDVDNDGEYEFIIKWDPTNRQDNSIAGYTGNVLIDCYKQNGTKLWRIDMGKNIRAGSHYTQIIVYDFDGDGKAEMALRTAPGSKDGNGDYVSAAGGAINGEALTWADAETGETFTDEDDLRSTTGGIAGKILKGPDWLTMFNGETGAAMQTVNYYPQRGNTASWGDEYANRSERYNAGVAYLDGVHPSLITARGYYKRAAMAAYDWDGESFSIRWTRDDTSKNKNLYGNGNHQVSVCDADNDGKDEIVFGSTVVDDDGEILNSTDHGHGDALHASDFDNDGEQEIFSVHEEAAGYKKYGAEVRKAKNAEIIAGIGASDDVGRGLMGNFDDSINDTSEFFSSADNGSYDFNGNKIGSAPANINPSFLVWWDGDLEREILSRTTILKYDTAKSSKKTVKSFAAVHFGDKDAPALSADLLGDWREEVCYPTEDNGTLRIFMTTYPTDYKIPTLMHDTQYREAIAWQNVGYNQPPHPKFYVGKAALAADKRCLVPAAGFDTISMVGPEPAFVYPSQAEGPEGPFTVTVKAAGDISSVISSQEVKGGAEYSYGFPRYILRDGFVYEAARNSTGAHYGATIANVTRDTNIPVTYTKKYSGVVYLEDIDKSASKSADVRASNCLAQDNSPYTSEYKLKPGISYTLVLGYNNTARGSSFVLDGKTLLTITEGGEGVAKGSWGVHTISGVTVEHESPLTLVKGPNNTYDPLDTVMIINENAQTIEPTVYDMTSLDNAVMSVTGATSVTADTVIIPGVTGDTGNKSPAGHIAYTAPDDGVLALTFISSATKNSSNYPRLYYCTDPANMTKGNAAQFFQATGANLPLDVKLNVSKGTTYYLFGYLYSYSSAFNYTIKNISFKPSFLSYPIKFKDYDGTVLKTKEVAAGVIPDYYGTPQRDADDMYEYDFAYWTPSLQEVTGAAEYTANYTQRDRSYYDVNLILNGGTIANGKEVTKHIYGQSEMLPDADDIVRDNYAFEGWYDNSTLSGEPVTSIPVDAKGTQIYYAAWKWASDESEPEGDSIEALGSYKDAVTIKRYTESSGDGYLIITAASNIGELILYSAVYDVDGRLVTVGSKKYNANAGDTRIDITKPAVGDGEAYKLMLWDRENKPVIEAIK